jgi:hypothetical protein
LHEIAHAVAGAHNGHNHEWVKACRQVGANPTRTGGEEVVAIPPYRAECTCGRDHVSYGKPRIPRICRATKQPLVYKRREGI